MSRGDRALLVGVFLVSLLISGFALKQSSDWNQDLSEKAQISSHQQTVDTKNLVRDSLIKANEISVKGCDKRNTTAQGLLDFVDGQVARSKAMLVATLASPAVTPEVKAVSQHNLDALEELSQDFHEKIKLEICVAPYKIPPIAQ